MDLEILDRLESRVDVAVSTVRDLRMENELLREETQGLEKKMTDLGAEVDSAKADRANVEELQTRCRELEQKLEGVRGRIQGMVEKMKALES
ncbi:MAG: hypothetical protein DHS20C21_15270 [Gemmatimonadota bacterium]|nr:MAG: hypothetical protein DHS20C21_15270 [Gemmatimonadota bacterium]